MFRKLIYGLPLVTYGLPHSHKCRILIRYFRILWDLYLPTVDDANITTIPFNQGDKSLLKQHSLPVI